jgi:predicted ribonuclease YlaK
MAKKINPVKVEKKDTSPKIFQRDKIDFDINIKERDDLTEKQKQILETSLHKDTRCIFIDGLYGTGKTIIAVLASLKLLNQKKVSEIIYVRNPVEATTTGKIGFIKGDTDEKMAPYLGPLHDKLEELLPEHDSKRLKNDNRVFGFPIGFVRGRSWNSRAIIVDEASSMSWDDLFLILSRCGEYTRIFFVGDSANQNDIGNKSGFKKMFDLFSDEESKQNGIYTFELKDYEDIKRSKLLQFVMVKTGLIKKEENVTVKDK